MRNCGKLLIVNSVSAPVAQLDRASGYEPEGREFESPRARHLIELSKKNCSSPLTVWLAVRRRRVGISLEVCENEREIIAKAALILVRTKTDARARAG